MHRLAAAVFVLLGGFAVMVLEIIGTRYLAKDFGGSFYIWISQIGVIATCSAERFDAARMQKEGAVLAPVLTDARSGVERLLR